MTISDWLMISAVLTGPILAVQVQKFIESWREAKQRKIYIFKTLMATRGTALSPRHVEALNIIDLEFSREKPKEKKVLESWNEYLDHLNNQRVDHNDPDYNIKMDTWTTRTNDLLADLLYEMAQALNYHFDKVHLKKGSYTPRGHTDIELEQNYLRRSLVGLFLGEKSIPVNLVEQKKETEENIKK